MIALIIFIAFWMYLIFSGEMFQRRWNRYIPFYDGWRYIREPPHENESYYVKGIYDLLEPMFAKDVSLMYFAVFSVHGMGFRHTDIGISAEFKSRGCDNYRIDKRIEYLLIREGLCDDFKYIIRLADQIFCEKKNLLMKVTND